MRDIVFVTPTDSKNILKESVGPLLLATILRSKGIESHILSFSGFGDPTNFYDFLEEGIRQICEKKPKILSFYTRSDCFHIMLKMAEAVKARLGCIVVMGGPQADIVARETLTQIPYVDYICCGEGENTVYPLFSSILRGEPDLMVDGLVYRKNGEVCTNPRPALIEDLDTIPMLDYSIFPEDALVDPKIAFPIDVGRGCPFGCTYCSTKTFWGRKYRLKSPKRIVEELRYYYDRFGVRHFVFQHDMFTMNKKLVMETCRLIKELPFKATWNCSARLDCVDRELIDIMADAGLYHIYLGIETGSPRMQKLVNKNLKLDGIIEEIGYLLSKNLQVTTSFICGFPEETEEDISQTLSMVIDLIRMRKVRLQMHRCSFLPGTALFEQYKDQMRPTDVYCDMTGSLGVAECQDLIRKHPSLFRYYEEYTTELRTKLNHFQTFLGVMKTVRPIYLYLAEKYPREDVIRMYYDFVEKNRETLERKDLSDEERIHEIANHDLFVASFRGDPCETQIRDYYQIFSAKREVNRGIKDSATVVTCISPAEVEKGVPLDQCTPAVYMVTYFKDDEGIVKIRIRHT